MSIENHLQYLQNMVEILNSLNQAPAYPNEVFRTSPLPPSLPLSLHPSLPSSLQPVVPVVPSVSPPFAPTFSFSFSFPPNPPRLSRGVGVYPGLLEYLAERTVRTFVDDFFVDADDDDEDDEKLDDLIEVELATLLFSQDSPVRDNRAYDPSHLRHAGEFAVRKDTECDCSICFESCAPGDTFVTSCTHTFHPKCLHTWLNRKDNCPICRHSFA